MQNQAIIAKTSARGSFTLTPETIGIGPTGSSITPEKAPVVRQNFIDRVRAYIPLEVLAFFIFVNSINDDVDRTKGVPPDSTRPTLIDGWGDGLNADDWVSIAAIVVSVIAIFIFVRTANNTAGSSRWMLQALMSVAAFFVWIYAINAHVFKVVGIEHLVTVSGFILATFTLFSGFVVPLQRENKTPPAGGAAPA